MERERDLATLWQQIARDYERIRQEQEEHAIPLLPVLVGQLVRFLVVLR